MKSCGDQEITITVDGSENMSGMIRFDSHSGSWHWCSGLKWAGLADTGPIRTLGCPYQSNVIGLAQCEDCTSLTLDPSTWKHEWRKASIWWFDKFVGLNFFDFEAKLMRVPQSSNVHVKKERSAIKVRSVNSSGNCKKKQNERFVLFCSITDHATPSTSQTNTECPVAVDTSDVSKMLMRPRHLTSCDHFREAIDLFQKMTWTHYVVRDSRLNIEKPEIRYEYVVHVCSFGHKKKPEGYVQRVKGSKFGGCKAMFRLRYAVNQFVISSSRMIHNHPCDEKCLKNDPWFRKLSEDQLKAVLPMVKTGSSAESIVKYAEENYEKTITVHYVNSLKYKFVERKLIPYIYGFLGCGSLNDVIATLRNNGKLFVSYGGVANQVTKIAFSTHEQIVTYKRFPEVVCLDSTYRGDYRPFQLVCTDNCEHGVPAMFAWTEEEKKVDVVWILDHFKKIMNGTSQTETFVMDCARSIISAVELTHRTAHIALCSFHMCRAICKKTRNPITKQYLCQLVREQTVTKFNETSRIISVRSRRIAAYLNKNWMSGKETWAAAFNSNVVTLGNNTNNRVESAHRQLKKKLSNRDALSKCIWKTFTWQRQLDKRRSLQSSLHCSHKSRYIAKDCLLPLLSKPTTYAGFIVLKDYKNGD
ncbi:Zinc finger, SWIM-type containing 3 [Schistosoma haematobium]|uniref:Zinc finger, SWIM-type containing 3 n=1 Tax=Schistosoma haematobium TaxID=6185 RepID=A0A922INE6_SCHHA|nr:Zinc finger, SWIM-type containing 3 [Schistosoma haematobium]KAH9583477.1 Zinc finger, SWIM-type containing 3 [Schistosoma haematobium]